MTARKKKSPSFEEGMRSLEELVEKLGNQELALEESIALYEQGTALASQLEEQLAKQRRRIEMIDPDTAEIEPFEEREHDVQ